MSKKILKIIWVIIILLGALLLLWNIYKKSKCGDGICQSWEQIRVSCQEDCVARNSVANSIQNDFCKIKKFEIIGSGAFPRVSKTGKITFTREVDNQYEVFTMNSDGSGEKCLTCGKKELSRTRFRGQSAWSPNEKYIVFTAETSKYPRKGTGVTTRPGIGRNHNIWMMTADGSRSWQLTNYPENWGAIEPYFSQDGTMISWGEEFMMEKYPNGKPGVDTHPGCYWGPQNLIFRKGEELCIWRIKFGKIAYELNGQPKLTEVKVVNPPANFTMIEPGGFLPDSQGFIYSYANLADSPNGRGLWPDIYTTDLNGSNLKQLTKTPQIEEETAYSPDGKKILVKRANKYPAGQNQDEIWLIDADQKNPIDANSMQQLTHFNDQGYPEYDSIAGHNEEHSWDPDGASFVVSHTSDAGEVSVHIPAKIYKFYFQGNCGNNK